MNILGISAFYHDSAVALVQEGRIVAAAQEERFSRKRHDHGFPSHAVAYCLGAGGITADDVDLVVFYEKPLLRFERLLETYIAYAPRGFRQFLMSIPPVAPPEAPPAHPDRPGPGRPIQGPACLCRTPRIPRGLCLLSQSL